MASSFETLVFEIIAKDAQASAAFDRFRRTVDQTSGAVDRNSATVDKNALTWKTFAATAAAGTIPALIGTGVALSGIAATGIAAGAGMAAFGALAVKSITPVTAALGAKGGLVSAWMTLDNQQQVAALGIQALQARFTGLSAAMEPRVFQVFNTALGLANSLLGPTAKLAAAAGLGFEHFLVQFSAHSGLAQFITFLSSQAGPAIALLGADVTNIAHAVFALLQSFGGAGLIELQALTGVITALTSSITWLSEHAPGLTAVALGIGGIAFALAKIGALSGVLQLAGVAGIGGTFLGAAKGADLFAVSAMRAAGATASVGLAARISAGSMAALEAVSPVGWAILGAAAVGGLVFWLSRFKTVTDTAIAGIEKQNQAQGFNTSGYYTAALALQAYSKATAGAAITTMNLHTGLVTGTVSIGQMTGATAQLIAEQKKLIAEHDSQLAFLATLESKYGLTRGQAIALAGASGVLASQVNKGGTSLKDATTQAEAFANSNLAAQGPTSQLSADMQIFANNTLDATTRTAGLTAAMKLAFAPQQTYNQMIVNAADDLATLKAKLDLSRGAIGLNTAAQRNSFTAFNNYIADVENSAAAAQAATGKTSDYSKVIVAALPGLYRLAGGNRDARKAVDDLAAALRALPSESSHITVTGTGSWSVTNVGPGGPGHRVGAAAGWRVPGYGGGDRIPVLVEGGETILPKHLTPLIAGFARAHGVPGFGAGGITGSYHDGVPGLTKWLNSENSATISAIASSVAAAFAAGTAGGAGGASGTSGSVVSWLLQAMADTMAPASWLPALEQIVARESGGNPYARNPSGASGLMQTMPGTYAAFATVPGGMFNPVSDAVAAIRYIMSQYGSPWNIPNLFSGNYQGYAAGGPITEPILGVGASGRAYGFHAGESVLPRGGGTVVNYYINVAVPVGANQAETGRQITVAIREHEKRSGKGWRTP